MKKFWKTLMFALVGVFALSSCEDVPAPYPIPGTGGTTPTSTELATVDLTQGLSGWAIQDKSGMTGIWSNSQQYGMVASGYKSGKANAAESWLVTSEIDLTEATESKLVVNEAINKIEGGNVEELMTVWATADDGATWTQLTANARPSGSSWNFQEDEFDLSAFDGKKVKVAFKYISTAEYAGTWEIKGIKVKGLGTASIEGGSTPGGATEVTCEQAAELTTDLDDGATSAEVYTITGYITEVVGSVSRNQQTFWMADTKDGGKVFEAYYANLPEGVNEFKVGMKVKITGNLMKYVNNGKMTPEIKNPNVEILEEGEGGGGGNTETGTPAGDGTKDNPYNVAAVINYVQGLGADVTSPNEVYVKGIVKSNNTTEATISQYGNMNFIMIDKGYEDAEFQAFQVYGLGGKKFTSASDIKVGDEVIVYGKVVNFRGNTPETVGKGAAYVYSLNGKTDGGSTPDPQPGETKGDGTVANPYNAAGVNAFIAAGDYSGKEIYFTGIISDNPNINTQYGNATFHISDDGQANSEQFYVYRTMGFNGDKIPSTTSLNKGDVVVIKSTVTVYNGNVYETETGKGVLISVNGKAEYSQGETPDTPDNPDVSGNSITFSEQGYENGQDFNEKSIVVGDAKLTFSKGSGSTTPKYYNTGTGMRLYGSNTLTISSTKTISKVIFTFDKGEDQNNRPFYATSSNTSFTPGSYDYTAQTWSGSANEVVLTYTGNGGHVRIQSIAITYAE